MPGYTLPDGLTLKNNLGATTPDELGRLEAPLVAARDIEIQLGLGPAGAFDRQHLQALHRHLFQDVYEWAGRTRDEAVPLSDGTVAIAATLRKPEGEPFAVGSMVTRGLDAVLRELADANYFVGSEREAFADRAGELFARVNSIHAFREGNGRTQRAFFTELAKVAGHPLEFDVVSRERMTSVSIAAHEQGDVSGVQRLFREISDPEKVAALRFAQTALDRHRETLDWRDYYMGTTSAGETYRLTFVGKAGESFMGRTNDAILIGRTADLPGELSIGDRFTMTAGEEPARAVNADQMAKTLVAMDAAIGRVRNSLDGEGRQAFVEASRAVLERDFNRLMEQRRAEGQGPTEYRPDPDEDAQLAAIMREIEAAMDGDPFAGMEQPDESYDPVDEQMPMDRDLDGPDERWDESEREQDRQGPQSKGQRMR